MFVLYTQCCKSAEERHAKILAQYNIDQLILYKTTDKKATADCTKNKEHNIIQ